MTESGIPQVSLESILCTEELQRRPSRPADYEKENCAFVKLMSGLADSPSTIYQTLVETILDVTQSHSAGLSLLTSDGQTADVRGKRFYWPAIAGLWKPYIGGGTPRDFGPCGDVLDRNCPLLFRHLERRYTYFPPPINECLLVPFYVEGKAAGTIWALAHDDGRKFDAEDNRVMCSLGKFASSAYQALKHIEDLKFQVSERAKAEAEVRELAKGLEAKIRRLVEANVVGIVMWNLEGAIIGANDAFLHMVQYDREDLASGHVRWTDLTPAEWRGSDERAIADLKASGIFQPFEKQYFRKDGSRVPVLLGGALFEESRNDGVAFVLDLSEQKRVEHNLRAAMAERARLDAVRAEVGMALARRDSLKGILHTCAEAIVHHLDAVFARIWTVTDDGLELELQASTGMYTRLDGRYSRIPFGRFKIGLIAQERKAHVTNDVQHDPRIDNKDWAIAEGIISFAGYPLVVEGRIVGVMGMFSREALGKSTVDTLASIADGIAQGIERKKAEEKLRQSEKQLRDVIETMPVIAFTSLSDGSTDFINRRWIEYTGLTAEEAGFYRRTTVHSEDIERHIHKWQESLASGEPFENEVRHRGANGQYRWFLVRGVPLRDEDNNVLKWFATMTDIEDRKQAEDRLRRENVALREEIDKASMFDEIVGTSPALKTVLSRVSKVARSDSTVLITGETGTGKELVARAIHRRSNRASRSFVSVNCAAIPLDLIASELFGHEKGAFTGATQQHLGRFELASGGTIFLDEVGEFPAETQIALLRVLQENEFERVGGTRRIRVDVRVIAATNRDLQAAIGAGTFRGDLFYRLHVFPIEIPPLRERGEDIPLLVEYFIDRYARKTGKNIRRVNKKTLELLQSYPWPGNIRELQNVIERSVILCETEVFSIDESWLPQQPLLTEAKDHLELPRRLLVQEKEMIEAALRECRGRVFGPTGAAANLGIPRSTLESKIRTLKIDKNRFRANPGT